MRYSPVSTDVHAARNCFCRVPYQIARENDGFRLFRFRIISLRFEIRLARAFSYITVCIQFSTCLARIWHLGDGFVSCSRAVKFLSEMYIWPSARMTWCLGSTEYVLGCLVPSRRMYCLLSALMMTDGDVLAKPS